MHKTACRRTLTENISFEFSREKLHLVHDFTEKLHYTEKVTLRDCSCCKNCMNKNLEIPKLGHPVQPQFRSLRSYSFAFHAVLFYS